VQTGQSASAGEFSRIGRSSRIERPSRAGQSSRAEYREPFLRPIAVLVFAVAALIAPAVGIVSAAWDTGAVAATSQPSPSPQAPPLMPPLNP